MPPLPDSLESSRQYQKRHLAQTSLTMKGQGIERPNGKRQLSSLGLKGKYFSGCGFNYVRDVPMALSVADRCLSKVKKFSKIHSQTESFPRMEKPKT